MNGKKFTVVVKSQYGSVSSTGILKVGSSPVISKHPVSVIGGLNVKIDFSVTVSGTEPLKYQWRKNGQNISGATQAIFSINSATLNDSGDYDVVVTNDFGTVYSQIANFIAGNKPVITTQPKSSISLVGSETVSVVATGTAPLTYQWLKDSVAISGATSSSYNITSDGTYKVIVSNQVGSVTSTDCVVGAVIAPRIITQPFGTTTPALLKVVATGTSLTYKWYKNGVEISGQTQDSYIANDAGTYKVVVSNAADSATSNDVTLITVQPPLITLQPVGGNAPTLLSVTATGTAPLTYQWYKDDVLIAGATSSTYNATEEGQYKVFVSNAGGTVLSNFVNVTNVIPPSITTQPVGGNTPLNLSVVADGTTPLTYQWYKDNILINGATSSTYNATQAGFYKVTVTNSAGSDTSTSVNVITITAPTITTQPVGGNTPLNLSVVATGTAPLTYQWYKDDVLINGATSSTYNATQAGFYKVTVTNSAGSDTSTSVNVILGTFSQLGSNLNGINGSDAFGGSVSINSSGDIIAIGGFENDNNGSNSGHVRVYKLNYDTWSILGSDINGDGISHYFGCAVSLNSSGDTVIIGGLGKNTNTGYVKVLRYDSNNNRWDVLGSVIDGTATNTYFGTSVSINSGGDIIAVGANGASSGRGVVKVYSWNGSSWNQLGSDIVGITNGEASGSSVSLNAEGNKLAIGCPNQATNKGGVRIYQYINSSWTQLGSTITGTNNNDLFGISVSLNDAGDRVAIGGWGYDTGNISGGLMGTVGNDAGRASIYSYNNNSWTIIGSHINGESGDRFGVSISLNGLGDVVAIGANRNSTNKGCVRIYSLSSDSTWQKKYTIVGQSDGDQSGLALSLNSSGDVVGIGARYNDGGGTDSGHVRVYSIP
jgi:hypothetical protein